MKILLPSHGYFGQKSVNMRIPTFGDIRDIQTYNSDDVLKKTHFIKMISDVSLDKVSWFDLEYLFNISAFSLMYNVLTYTVICPKCKTEYKTNLRLSDLDIRELKKNNAEVKTKEGYTFHILTAQQMLDAYELAQFEEDSVTAFEDMQVALTLGYDISEHQKMKDIPNRVYVSTFVYQKLNFHGLNYIASTSCKCGHNFEYKYKVTPDILSVDIDFIMEKYADVAESITLSDFLSMTFIDYNAFVKVLNKKMQ